MGAVLGVVGGVAGGVIGNKQTQEQIDEGYPGAEVKRVGEGIQLVLNENAVRFDTNKSSLTAMLKFRKLVPVLNILILILPFLVILISPVLQTII
jgi:hypothetical protein